MALKYVYSGAAGTGTGADWTNAYTTLAAAASGAAAGDSIYVAHDHAETQGSAITIAFTTTSANPQKVYCVNRAGTVPPVAADLATTATITTTGAFGITTTGSAYVYGITFNCGTGVSAANVQLSNSNHTQTYKSCAFNLVTTASSSLINISGSGSTPVEVVWDDVTVSFGAAGQGIKPQGAGKWIWRNKPGSNAITGATVPTALLNAPASNMAPLLDGLDLSALGSGKTLVSGVSGETRLVNCKLGGSVTVASTAINFANQQVDLIGCNSTTNVARNERYNFSGTLTTETTIIRTSGASDGTTAYSWKVVTTANAKAELPFETFEGTIWNTATGSGKTLSIEIGGPAAMTNADAWLEVEYLGSSATPVASLVSSGPATPLTTASNLTTNATAWGSTPGTTYTLTSPSFTPQMAGPIRWKVKVAKASATIYIDPKPTVA